MMVSAQAMRVAGLFAGIGGFEVGLARAGHQTVLLCEKDERAQLVLKDKFPDVPLFGDVEKLDLLPGIDLVCAGFPCQNLSMAGDKKGLEGDKSGIVSHLFRLLEGRRVPWVVIENVYFMLHLDNGSGIAGVLEPLERLGYRWAYRVVDSRSFGLAQRRRRVFIVASTSGDPRQVLLADERTDKSLPTVDLKLPIGFFWTEGRSGHGLTGDAIPPLKAGSALGIPSAPAVLLPNGRVVVLPIQVAEALQGFARNWTAALDQAGCGRYRWRLVGNAVSVPVAEWIGSRLQLPGVYDASKDLPLRTGAKWPNSAWNMGNGRYASGASAFPVDAPLGRLSDFDASDWPDLSARAIGGFIRRARASNLRYPNGFLDVLESHMVRKTSEMSYGRASMRLNPSSGS
jgi:DNA (cytosine-5)-methyltransferase 1